MTFIYARKIKNSIQINSDTYLNFEKKVKPNLEDTIIKSLILSKYLTISFSNTHIVACKLIKRLVRSNYLTLDRVLKIIEEIPPKDLDQISFIITVLEGSEYEIIRIRRGIIERNLQSAYIGEKDAFELYQKEYHSLELEGNKKYIEEFVIQNDAFEKVIQNSNIQTVGGFNICICSYQYGFEYNFNTEVFRPRLLHLKDNLPQKLDFGNAEMGSFSVIYLPCSQDPSVLAIYLEYGSFGLFFNPIQKAFKAKTSQDEENILKCTIIKNKSGLDFTKYIQDKYNLTIGYFGLTPPPVWQFTSIKILSFIPFIGKEEFLKIQGAQPFTVGNFTLNTSNNKNIITLILDSGYLTMNHKVLIKLQTQFAFQVSTLPNNLIVKNGIIEPIKWSQSLFDIAINTQRGLLYQEILAHYNKEIIFPLTFFSKERVGLKLIIDDLGFASTEPNFE